MGNSAIIQRDNPEARTGARAGLRGKRPDACPASGAITASTAAPVSAACRIAQPSALMEDDPSTPATIRGPPEFRQYGQRAGAISFQVGYGQLGFPVEVVRDAARVLQSSPVYGLLQATWPGCATRRTHWPRGQRARCWARPRSTSFPPWSQAPGRPSPVAMLAISGTRPFTLRLSPPIALVAPHPRAGWPAIAAAALRAVHPR